MPAEMRPVRWRHPARGLISMDSPVGRGLLGKRVDDAVRVRRPKGDLLLVILEIG